MSEHAPSDNEKNNKPSRQEIRAQVEGLKDRFAEADRNIQRITNEWSTSSDTEAAHKKEILLDTIKGKKQLTEEWIALVGPDFANAQEKYDKYSEDDRKPGSNKYDEFKQAEASLNTATEAFYAQFEEREDDQNVETRAEQIRGALATDKPQIDDDTTPEQLQEILMNALGAKVTEKLSPRMRDRLQKEEHLRTIINEMTAENIGSKINASKIYVDRLVGLFDADDARAAVDRLTTGVGGEAPAPTATTPAAPNLPTTGSPADQAPTGDAGLQARGFAFITNWRIRAAEKREARAQKLREEGYTEEQIKKKEIIRKRVRWGLGAAGLIAAGTATWFLIHRHGGSTGGGNGGQVPGGAPSGHEGAADYFNMPDTSKMADKLQHPNDFAPSNPYLLGNFNKDQAIQHINDTLRGNPNITAMWASQLHISGAPTMPSIQELRNSDSVTSAFNIKVNDWGQYLQDNPKIRSDVTNQIIEKLHNANWGDTETLRYGYMSPGANNTAGQIIYGARPAAGTSPHEAFIDPSVGYGNEQGRVITIDGQTYDLLTCDQLSEQPPVQAYAAFTPGPVSAPVQEVVPPSVEQPPVTINQPPVINQPPEVTPPTVIPPTNTPPTGTPPVTPPTGLTPKNTPRVFADNPNLKPVGSGRLENTPAGVARSTTVNGVNEQSHVNGGAAGNRPSGLAAQNTAPHAANPAAEAHTVSSGSATSGARTNRH